MASLNLSDSTARSDSRLKNIFWPSIQSSNDVDYLGTQGFWVCSIIAGITLVMSVLTGQAIIGVVMSLFFFLGGVGVRERSRYAAAVVFVMYVLDTLTSPSIVRWILTGLLLSNLRATWIAATWKPESTEASPVPRFNESWTDKFADQLPTWLWPKIRIFFYVFSVVLFAVVALGLVVIIRRGRI
jgi:hypothetical protein